MCDVASPRAPKEMPGRMAGQVAFDDRSLRLGAVSALPPPEFRVLPAPLCVTLAVLADHYAKTYARLAIALVAKLMEADHLRLPGALSTESCTPHQGCNSHQYGGDDHREF